MFAAARVRARHPLSETALLDMHAWSRRCRTPAVLLLAVAVATGALAAEAPPEPPPTDTAPCLAAIATHDDDQVVARCAVVIDDIRTNLSDRMAALIARGGIFVRQNQADRAIADYDVALLLDPAQAGLFNARGELWRQKGDRPRAIRDFAAALRLDPQNEAARRNHKDLAYEIERLGADMAVKNASKGTSRPPLK
jgi:tetratricopeptide (TPR) repeat protein